jgi:hypothetical protein
VHAARSTWEGAGSTGRARQRPGRTQAPASEAEATAGPVGTAAALIRDPTVVSPAMSSMSITNHTAARAECKVLAQLRLHLPRYLQFASLTAHHRLMLRTRVEEVPTKVWSSLQSKSYRRPQALPSNLLTLNPFYPTSKP